MSELTCSTVNTDGEETADPGYVPDDAVKEAKSLEVAALLMTISKLEAELAAEIEKKKQKSQMQDLRKMKKVQIY